MNIFPRKILRVENFGFWFLHSSDFIADIFTNQQLTIDQKMTLQTTMLMLLDVEVVCILLQCMCAKPVSFCIFIICFFLHIHTVVFLLQKKHTCIRIFRHLCHPKVDSSHSKSAERFVFSKKTNTSITDDKISGPK